MKLWTLTTFCTVSLLTFSGCVGKPVPSKEPVVDRALQSVQLTRNGTIIDTNAIAFEWKSIKDPKVNGVYIYKMGPSSKDPEPKYYDTVDNRFSTHYLDKNIKADTRYSYYFKTYSDKAESLKSETVVVNSLPVIESVSWISTISNMPRSAKIIWRPHSNQKVKAYEIQRSTLENTKWEKIATVSGRLNAEYIDKELKDSYTYKYRILSLTFDSITSTPSTIVTSVTKALPNEINNLVVSRNLPKKIELNWVKTNIKDFSHYNVYRSKTVNGGYDLIAKTEKNSYVNKVEEDGKQYFYRVSIVDKDGLESSSNEQSIQGLTLVKPNAPALVEAKMVNNKVKLVWSKTDPRTSSYTVSKRYKKGMFDEVNEDFEGIKSKKFTDSNIEPNTTYYYKIYAIDNSSIKSEPSFEVEFTTKKEEVVSNPNVSNNLDPIEPLENSSDMVVEEVSDDIVSPTNDFN